MLPWILLISSIVLWLSCDLLLRGVVGIVCWGRIAACTSKRDIDFFLSEVL